jgi:hypothetical protein
MTYKFLSLSLTFWLEGTTQAEVTQELLARRIDNKEMDIEI